MIEKYSYGVAWSQADKAFIARVAEFPSLAAHGDTQAEALVELRTVVADVVKDLKRQGEPVPVPLGSQRYSGKTNLRMPPALHQALALEARQMGVSLNQLITLKLAAGVGR